MVPRDLVLRRTKTRKKQHDKTRLVPKSVLPAVSLEILCCCAICRLYLWRCIFVSSGNPARTENIFSIISLLPLDVGSCQAGWLRVLAVIRRRDMYAVEFSSGCIDLPAFFRRSQHNEVGLTFTREADLQVPADSDSTHVVSMFCSSQHNKEYVTLCTHR